MPTIATSRGYQFAYVKETVFGTTPASAMKLMRTTGAAIKIASSSVESEETQLAEVPDVIRVSADGTFEISGEYSYGAVHDLLEGLFGNVWTTNVLKVGTTRIGFTVEDQYTDIAQFLTGKGTLIEGFTLSLQQGSKITFKITGRISGVPTAYTGTSAGTGGATAAPTNAIMSPVSSVQLMQEGGAGSLATTYGVTAFNMEFARPSITGPQLGSLSLADAAPSVFTAKGSVSLYVANAALLNKYLADTPTSLALNIGGAASLRDNYLFSRVRLTDGGIAPVGRGNAAIQTLNWQATFDPTNTTCQITRTP